jgi:hypothetical protein
MSVRAWLCRFAICTSLIAVNANATPAPVQQTPIYHPDHYEFDTSLRAPFQADAHGVYPLTLQFDYPGAGSQTMADWQVEVLDPHGRTVWRWIGESGLPAQHRTIALTWDGHDSYGRALGPGYYTVRLSAVPSVQGKSDSVSDLSDRVHRAFALFRSEVVTQSYDVMVGRMPTPIMPIFHALPQRTQTHSATNSSVSTQSTTATGSLPYTIYYGNLHSQTNHSDGGGPLATCTGAQNPQSAALGPTDAYTMMQNQAHGDFLMTSEHNHMFDGSTGTNTSANPATAKALFASGLTAAANYNAAHPGFLALYGVEWGVISNGGHMNIFNASGLPEWEYNSSNQLIGDFFTPKSDYAAIYATMKTQGWIGMFNHPASSGQFNIGGTDLAYDANGDQVMVLAEVLNSSAFSTNTTETESSRSSYQPAFDILLERGYHVAPTTDQDNHCANWGLSYRNRTGVLLPNGTALNMANFLDALRARRVFAAEDKNGQIILTGNGAIMGQTINNSGPLTLVANYASANGQTAARVQFFQGVPGSNGTVTQLYEGSGSTTVTPTTGAHFYYAEITQSNGDRLWSAPIWVNQGTGGDTTPPTATASESGSSGTITLSATASDNVGVTKVEFYVDGVLKGSDTSSPYSMTLDSTTLSNGSHALVAKAYDAANNIGSSSSVAFSISNATGDTTPPTATASESGSSGTITLSANASDNVGVTKVEFYVDGVLKGSSTTSPYSMTLDSTTLSNGSHALVAKAYDAANNVGSSSSVAFSISNATGDTTPPTATASESGSSGTITLSATASDNVGVTKVEFYVDGVLKGSSTTSPYSMTLDSTTLANASHSLVAKAYDAAGNVGTSTAVTFSVSNSTGGAQLIGNSGFESGNTVWSASSGVIDSDTSEPAHAGSWKAWLDGYGSAHTDTLSQQVTIPAGKTSATLQFYMHIDTAETTTTSKYDTMTVQVYNTSGGLLGTLYTYSNLNANTGYSMHNLTMTPYIGQTVVIKFTGTEDSTKQTSFVVDDVTLNVQ